MICRKEVSLLTCVLWYTDVDHRIISMTHQPPLPRSQNTVDQDYRVPPMVPPPDIVESVDMDLSDDEDQQGMYGQNQIEHRRPSFNNNKVLVGGDNDKQNHKEKINSNLIQINSITIIKDGSHSEPVMPPLSNSFDNMPLDILNLCASALKFNMSPALKQLLNFPIRPPNLKNMPQITNQPKFQNNQPEFHNQQNFQNKPPEITNQPPTFQKPLEFQNQPLHFQNKPEFQQKPVFQQQPEFQKQPEFQQQPEFQKQPEFQQQPAQMQINQPDYHAVTSEDNREVNSDGIAYVDDLKSRSLDNMMMARRNSASEFDDFVIESDWGHGPWPFIIQQFPRNWGPRTNFSPQGFCPQFRPRIGPRPPNMGMGPRWGLRPQRFW